MLENNRVLELREQYGIKDSRNEYTEEQIEVISKQKIYHISTTLTNDSIIITPKLVLGYLSDDGCIFIKDREITGRDCYTPVFRMNLNSVKEAGVLHDTLNGISYCLTEDSKDLDSCLAYLSNFNKQLVAEEIVELEKELYSLRCKWGNIVINKIE